MEGLKKKDSKKRLSFSLFKNRKHSSDSLLITDTNQSLVNSSSGIVPVKGRERSNTADSAPTTGLSLESFITIKEKRQRKRATVCFEMNLRSQLDAIAEEEKQREIESAACPKLKSPQREGRNSGKVFLPTKTLHRSASWAELKKLGEPTVTSLSNSSTTTAPCKPTTITAKTKLDGNHATISLYYERMVDKPIPEKEDVLPVTHDLPQAVRKRNMVINEIIHTERDYVHDLEVVISFFRKPLSDENIITKEELHHIFSNVHLLVEVNKMLLTDMIERVKDDGNELGQSFLFLGDGLKMYATYCSNHAQAVETMGKLEKSNARFRACLASAYQQTQRLTLKDYLIKPVQRICKYPLLLRELIKYTDAEHPDYAHLNSALSKIQGVVATVNEKKQLEDDVEAMAKVIARLKNTERFGIPLMVPGRQYLQEGTLLAASKGYREQFQPRHYFLFSDLIVLTEGGTSPRDSPKKNGKHSKAQPRQREVVDVLPFSNARVNLKTNIADEQSNSIEIESTDSFYVLPFIHADQKKKWVQSHLHSVERSLSSSNPIQRKHSS